MISSKKVNLTWDSTLVNTFGLKSNTVFLSKPRTDLELVASYLWVHTRRIGFLLCLSSCLVPGDLLTNNAHFIFFTQLTSSLLYADIKCSKAHKYLDNDPIVLILPIYTDTMDLK